MFSFLMAAQTGGSQLILSNTVIGFAAGVALLLLVVFARQAGKVNRRIRRAWACTFGALGGVLTIFGVQTSISWPLIGAANLIFGEPAVIFGVLLLATAVIIYQTPIQRSEDKAMSSEITNPLKITGVEYLPDELRFALRPVAYVGAFTGPMLIILAVAGAVFGEIVFRPPPNEFPTGIIAGTGIESIYFVITYGLLGLGAMTLPVGLHNRSWLKPTAYLFVLSGILLLLVTFASFMGHVSLSTGIPPGGIPWPPK